MTRSNKLIFYALGVFTCYFYFGLLQEKITRSKYGEGEKFTCTLSLVFVQCFINACFAKLVLMTFMKQGKDDTKQKYYVSGAISYLGAMVASNMALQHINYPTQVIGKSCKPIPVMILGVLIGRKRYAFAKYVYVLMIVLGVCLFMYKDKKSLSSSRSSSVFGMGEALLIISLSLDGFTGAIQERMKTEHKTKSGHMMLNMNLWSTLFSGAALILTKEIWFFIDFVQRYPYIIQNILLFSISSALGQLFIFLTVSEFGPLPCSIVTTTRKFFTVLGSVIIFGNTLRPYQWFGTVLVFTGLALDSFYGKASSDKKK